MKDITINLSLDEINLIIRALAKEPFKDVYELIGKVNEQADLQLKQDSNGIEKQA